MRLARKDRGLTGSERTEQTIETLKRTLRHPDPAQLSSGCRRSSGIAPISSTGSRCAKATWCSTLAAISGVAAAFFALECNAGLVHSFEPVTPIFELLRENLRHFPACVPHIYGLSSRSRYGTITYYPTM